MNLNRAKLKTRRGRLTFTLIKLLVVVATIVIPAALGSQQEKGGNPTSF